MMMATIAKRSGHWLLALTMLLVPVAQADESKGWNEASAVIEGQPAMLFS